MRITSWTTDSIYCKGAFTDLARLKQLDINGFKSFANPTTFLFDRGVTAIIGPNGSGKSNISEALRWVLGEQQYSNLRSRRTEDIIFGGSDRRGRLGLAEVSLTIDNSSGLLPIEFSEVNVTRRAHRSGENQYLINGNRVRLRDIQQLTAPLGQAHTIVGQGLVDAVLSQRPDDRRGLFEHAAGVTGLRMQTVSAERGLAEAEENAQRLGDIIGELEPRVRSLARRARQAHQYESVREELNGLQRGYYGALWIQARERLQQAQASQKTAAAFVAACEQAHSTVRHELHKLMQDERRLASERAAAAERVSTLEATLSETRHQLELVEAESRAAQQRSDERLQAQERVETDRAEQESALAEIVTRLGGLRAELIKKSAAHDQLSQQQAESQRQRTVLEEQLTEIDLERQSRTERLNQIDVELAGSRERSLVLQRSIDDLEGRLNNLSERVSNLDRDIERSGTELAEATALVEETRQRRDEVERTLDRIEGELQREQAQLRENERNLDRLRGRLELLDRIWSEGEGLHAGVRAVLRAVRRGDLTMTGLIGTVAETVDVPKEYETAIEIALGGHLQDIIVRDWDAAATGINYLKSSGSGRARFQPLDSIRRYHPRRLDGRPSGLIDRATELIAYDAEIAPVMDQLLGRTLIAQDLDAAHHIASEIEGWTIVTLQGDLVAPAGSVTGGSRTRGAGLLARERERRGLPAKIAEIEIRLEETRNAIRTLQRRQERQVDELQILDSALTEARDHERDALERQRRSRREVDAETSAISRQGQELELLRGNLERIASASESLRGKRATVATELLGLDNQRAQIEAQIEKLPSPDDNEQRSLAAELATLQERIRSIERERIALKSQIERALLDSRQQAEEITRINARRSELKAESSRLQETVEQLTCELTEERNIIPPIVDQLIEIRARIESGEAALEERSRELREGERRHDQAALDAARAGDGC